MQHEITFQYNGEAIIARQIPATRLVYYATASGRVFKLTTKAAKEIKQFPLGKPGNEYLQVCIDAKNASVHRLIARTWLQQPEPQQTIVRHKNGIRTDNRASNLAWGTYKENYADSVEHQTVGYIRPDRNAKISRAHLKRHAEQRTKTNKPKKDKIHGFFKQLAEALLYEKFKTTPDGKSAPEELPGAE